MPPAALVATITTELREHPAARVWHDVQGAAGSPERIDVLRKPPPSEIYRLVGIGPRHSNVIAKRCRAIHGWTERTVYEDILGHLPVTAPRYYGFKDDGGWCWLLLEDVGSQRYPESSVPHRALAGRWLGLMHLFAARSPDAARAAERLPEAGPGRYLAHLHAACEAILRNLSNPALPDEDVALLETIVREHRVLEARWDWLEEACGGVASTLVHGDFRPKNVYVRDDPSGVRLLPIDWEMAGWGVPATDLPRVDLHAYWSVVREGWTNVDFEAIRRLATFGQIFRFLAAISWATTSLHFDSYQMLERPMASLRVLRARLGEAIASAGSGSSEA
jgi:aminoglycoside phosphotransferase (APT) family kinase protein